MTQLELFIRSNRKTIQPPEVILFFTPVHVVVDRGYVDFKWLSDLDSSGSFFVTGAKTNLAYSVNEIYQVAADVLFDQDITLNGYHSKKDYPKKLRLIRYLDSSTGNEYRFLNNNLTWASKTVADIYKERWHIKVFFKQIKQNMKIKSLWEPVRMPFLSRLWTALTAILLLKFLKDKAEYDWDLSNLVTFIRLNLFVKIELSRWLNHPFYHTDTAKEAAQLNMFDG